jgi:HD-GYP domain-containing protein (c-di-GMP phosphodiesterase class II)
MVHNPSPDTIRLLNTSGSLNQRLSVLHNGLLEKIPALDRIACALYEEQRDTLKTFINSTRNGKAISGYEYKLSESRALSELARTGQFRVLDDIAAVIDPSTTHSAWLQEQGYRSSFTVPIYDQDRLQGFVFFDSREQGTFTPVLQRDLVLYCSLVAMSISNEFASVQMLVETARVARELAEMRDFETGTHLERMGQYARLIARHLAPRWQLDDEFIEHVFLFAPLHDVGKIAIPDRILLKNGRLDPDERVIMETHVAKGLEIIDRITGSHALRHLPDPGVLRNIVGKHHEYLNGSGYPNRLRAKDIPAEARIVTVADIYDALTAVRPYKKVWSHADAVQELQRMAQAGQLDPDCVEAMAVQEEEVLAIQRQLADI